MAELNSKVEKELSLIRLLRDVRDMKYIVKNYINMKGTTNDFDIEILKNPERIIGQISDADQ